MVREYFDKPSELKLELEFRIRRSLDAAKLSKSAFSSRSIWLECISKYYHTFQMALGRYVFGAEDWRLRPEADLGVEGNTILSLPHTGHSCMPHHFDDINDRNADKVTKTQNPPNRQIRRERGELASLAL